MATTSTIQQTPTQTTSLTFNVESVVTFQGGASLVCQEVIKSHANILWATQTNTATPEQTLGQDASVGAVILHKGAIIKQNTIGSNVQVTFTGDVTDSGSTISINGLVIGNFATG